MIITRHDKPIGQAQHGAMQFAPERKPKPKRRTLATIAAEHGIHPQSVVKFRSRHRELSHWTVDQVVAQIVANKDQSAVARRQGQKRAAGQRPKFGRMSYGDAT